MKRQMIKILFEENNAGANVEIKGPKVGVKAALMSIMEQMAEMEGVTIVDILTEMLEVAKSVDEMDIENMSAEDLLATLLADHIDKFKDQDCDGDCENCDQAEEMHPEVKDLINKLRGGLN